MTKAFKVIDSSDPDFHTMGCLNCGGTLNVSGITEAHQLAMLKVEQATGRHYCAECVGIPRQKAILMSLIAAHPLDTLDDRIMTWLKAAQ